MNSRQRRSFRPTVGHWFTAKYMGGSGMRGLQRGDVVYDPVQDDEISVADFETARGARVLRTYSNEGRGRSGRRIRLIQSGLRLPGLVACSCVDKRRAFTDG